jgi:hypothetical protein
MDKRTKNKTFITRQKAVSKGKALEVITVLELLTSLSNGDSGTGVAHMKDIFVLNLN